MKFIATHFDKRWFAHTFFTYSAKSG